MESALCLVQNSANLGTILVLCMCPLLNGVLERAEDVLPTTMKGKKGIFVGS